MVSSIRGPPEARARRPCAPPSLLFCLDFDGDDASPLVLISDSISAARMAGSSEFHREDTSSGIADAMML